MFVISGYVQNYAWGIPGGLSPWLSDSTAADATAADTNAADSTAADANAADSTAAEARPAPQAELWFGAHPNGPSPLVGRPGTLADVVAVDEVPLLVKILAARCPLSIQLHPDAELAARWYTAGSDLVSDPHAKEEMLVALQDFAVFAGWRALGVSAEVLSGAGNALVSRASASAKLNDAAGAVAAGDLDTAVRGLLSVDADDVTAAAEAVRGALIARGSDPAEVASYELAAETFPGDNGLLVLALMDHRVLTRHSAVYMPVGGVHSYANGVGLEVMTASDNVLRLGLTGKRVAVDEALSALRDDSDPHFLSGEAQVHLGEESRVDYQPEGAAFHLTLLESAEMTLTTGRYRCVLALEGTTSVRSRNDVATLSPGEACIILARESDVEVTGGTLTAVVTDVGAVSE